jgi:transcriptional regulator with XRE-family HTH domain
MPQPRKVQQNIHEAQTQIIARQLKLLRKKQGLTQAELAEKVGLSLTAIAAYEAGRVHIVDVTLVDITKALNVSADELLGLKIKKGPLDNISLRLIKRMMIIEALSEASKKHILKIIDDSIIANKRT